jgi:uncharacterized protein YggT (Ycf19 family)
MNVSLPGLVFSLATWGLLLLAAQGAVFFLSFGKHETNVVYQIIRFVTGPITKPVRWITPNKVADKHVPFVAFLLLFWIAIGFSIYLGKAARGLAS